MFLKGRRDAAESGQRQRDLIIAYKTAFSGEDGKAVLFDLMNKFHILNSHDGSAGKEGERKVVLHIMHQLNINLEAFDAMLKGNE
jgi:hypothetical protein